MLVLRRSITFVGSRAILIRAIQTDTDFSKAKFFDMPNNKGDLQKRTETKAFIPNLHEEVVSNLPYREFEDIKVEKFKELYGDDLELKKKIQVILEEYDYIKYNSLGRVPTKLSESDMEHLLNDTDTPNGRTKVFDYLFKRELARRSYQMKRERLQAVVAEKKVERMLRLHGPSGQHIRTGLLNPDGDIMYGLWHNSLFPRIHDNKVKSGSSMSRLMQAAKFGRKLIFDFDYDDYMKTWKGRNAMEQVQEAYGINRFHYLEPFDIWFCNFRIKTSENAQYMANQALRNLYNGSMITIKEDCFTNHFDKSRLVYLSPNSKVPLGNVAKSDDIYIIGVYNDKGNNLPISYRKAVKLGLRTCSLPLDKYVAWQGPSKSLCVQHVTGILLEVMSNGGDWHKAFFKHIPTRKIKPEDVVAGEAKIRRENQRLRTQRILNNAIGFSLREDFEWN